MASNHDEKAELKKNISMRKNILFNTTRQWNPGDQIIMLGLLRLLRHLDFNIFIYNRHPSVWGQGKDNSFKPCKHTLENIDYYIHAGTPEWCDQKLKPLFDEVLEKKIPHSFIGVGGSGTDALKTFDSLRGMLQTSDLLTARDQSAFETIEPLGGVLFPCPGFYYGELPSKPIQEVNTYGLIFMTCETNPNTISPRLHLELIEEYKACIRDYNAIIICHYIDEALEARRHFPDTPIYYSYDAKDYPSFYALCDLVIGPRLHGVLLAAGMGIPSCIAAGYRDNDRKRRLEGVSQLDLPRFEGDGIDFAADDSAPFDVAKESKRLIDLRYKTEAEYLDLISKRMVSLYSPPATQKKAQTEIKALINVRRVYNEAE